MGQRARRPPLRLHVLLQQRADLGGEGTNDQERSFALRRNRGSRAEAMSALAASTQSSACCDAREPRWSFTELLSRRAIPIRAARDSARLRPSELAVQGVASPLSCVESVACAKTRRPPCLHQLNYASTLAVHGSLGALQRCEAAVRVLQGLAKPQSRAAWSRSRRCIRGGILEDLLRVLQEGVRAAHGHGVLRIPSQMGF